MSATILAAHIVSKWDELAKDSTVNRETIIRNMLIEFQHQTVEETVNAIFGGLNETQD